MVKDSNLNINNYGIFSHLWQKVDWQVGSKKNHLQKRVKVCLHLFFCKFLMTCQNPPKVFNKEVQFTKQKVSFTTQQSNS